MGHGTNTRDEETKRMWVVVQGAVFADGIRGPGHHRAVQKKTHAAMHSSVRRCGRETYRLATLGWAKETMPISLAMHCVSPGRNKQWDPGTLVPMWPARTLLERIVHSTCCAEL